MNYNNASTRSARSRSTNTSLPDTALATALDGATREQVRQAADAISVDPKRLRRIAEGFPNHLGTWAQRRVATALGMDVGDLFPRRDGEGYR